MIVELSALAVAGGLLIGRFVAKRHARTLPPLAPSPIPLLAEESGSDDGEDSREKARSPSGSGGDDPVEWSTFPCALGDVVIRTIDGAEAWLAGAIVLWEDAPAAALFIAPDASGERAIYVRSRPSADIAWLAQVPPSAIVVGAEPPSAIEIEGVRFERRRRLPFRTQRWGTGTFDIGENALVGEYAAASGDVAVVLIAEGVARAWRGRRLGEGEFEVWSGEKARG